MCAGANNIVHGFGDRLVVIPTDPLAAYDDKGLENLFDYFNPSHMFKEVYVVSPLEKGVWYSNGLHVIGTTWRGLKAVLADLKPQVVRAYGGYWASDLAIHCKVHGIPVVVSIHDAPPVWPHASVRYADRVICMSHVVARAAVTRGVNPSRIRILPNRVDLDKFKPAVVDSRVLLSLPAKEAQKVILHVGRLVYQKNQETLIGALTHLPDDYHAYFVGRGDRDHYLARAQACGVASRCHWIDSVKNSNLPLWFNSCDCFCTPSRFEGFGVVFIEAAACGCPIVTSNISPMNEYLEHTVSAHLVDDYESPEILGKAILQVCEDETYRKSLQKQARLAAQPYERKHIDKSEADIYLEVMGCQTRVFSVAERLVASGCFYGHRLADTSTKAFWSAACGLREAINTFTCAFHGK